MTSKIIKIVISVLMFFLAAPFLIKIVSSFFIHKNDIEAYYQDYIDGAYEIEVQMPKRDSPDYLVKLAHKSIHRYFSSDLKGKITCWYTIFFDHEYKKHFILLFFNMNGVGYINRNISGKKVKLTVNKYEMNNSEYGTADNPIPVLKVIGSDESLRADNLDYNEAFMEKSYRDNNYLYLSSYLSKEKFKRLFGSNK